MVVGISKAAQQELLAAVRLRYARSTKVEKVRILDELVSTLGCHRKHAIRLLRKKGTHQTGVMRQGRRVYDEAVVEALVVLWEAADRICGKRLVRIVGQLVTSMERHGHINLEPEVRTRVLSASAATIDRVLRSVRESARGERKRRRLAKKSSQQIPTRTFADWMQPRPGYLEIDFVVHSGGSMAGSFLHSLVVTDVHSGWTEAVPLLAREQSLVVEGLEVIRRRFPVPLLGIDSDNDSAFINDTLLTYCTEHKLEFTRCRPYRKNDQAWIEQKNGAVIRRFIGHERYEGVVAGQSMAYLHEMMRLYVNYFQPSMKLRGKVRNGSKTKKTYFLAATPCERLLAHELVAAERKEALRAERDRLDPLSLLHRIREAQAALVSLKSAGSTEGPPSASLDQFLAQLPRLWQTGEARPTHRREPSKARYWRTRVDPFEGVWSEVLLWLQGDPDATAKGLFQRLQREYPDRFPDGNLRTLQRRVKEWRRVMAKQLVYSCLNGAEHVVEPRAIGTNESSAASVGSLQV